jgi:CubicO group peptidase (beta-lactamase class C family)
MGIFDRKRIEMEGMLHPAFKSVADMLERQLRNYDGGAGVCVYHHGQCVVDLWGGERDSAGRRWQRDTLAPSFSTTKGVASTIVHIMVDRGLLDYDAAVADYWPEFAQAGKRDITLRQVLAHQSGLYHIRQMIDNAERMLDWDYMVKAIERTAPIHKPGTRTGYHGLTYGFLVGELLRRVTGRTFPELVREEIAEPLDLDGMYVGAPREALERAAELIWPQQREWLQKIPMGPMMREGGRIAEGAADWLRRGLGQVGVELDLVSLIDALAPRGIRDFDFSAKETLSASIPAANGLFTARSLARMYACLAAGGELDGVRLLSQRTLQQATRVQNEAPGRAVLPIDMRWRLGYHGVATTRGFPPRGFGHFGFGGSGGWADPSLGLGVALIVNCGMGSPFGDLRTARISGAALACARARSGDEADDVDIVEVGLRSAPEAVS